MMAFDNIENRLATQYVELVAETKGSSAILEALKCLTPVLSHPSRRAWVSLLFWALVSAMLPEEHGYPIAFVQYNADIMAISDRTMHYFRAHYAHYAFRTLE